jgi:hypothetical protein
MAGLGGVRDSLRRTPVKIDRQYLPIVDICPKDKDTHRAVLTHLLLERIDGANGRLSASDGFMLAVVPVTLDDDDVPGLVHADALTSAAKDCPKREGVVTLYVLEDIVRSVGHACFPRTRGVSEYDTFPDLSRVIPRNAHVKASELTGAQTALNPTYLMKAHKALGGIGTVLWPTGPMTPIVVTPVVKAGGRGGYSAFQSDGLPVLPYAVVMPMHVTGGIARPKGRETAA